MQQIKTLNSNDYLFDNIQTIGIFFGIVGCMVLLMIFQKLYFYTRYKKKYFIFPRISTNGITSIAMTIAISISLILLLTTITAGVLGILFRAYPGWRVTIESILIKIGGLIFGPIIGIFIGASIDLLGIIMTAGMFHYGYFIAAIAFGFFSGIIRLLINYSKKNNFRLLLNCIIFATIISIVLNLFIYYQPNTSFEITLLSIDIKLTKQLMILILWSMYAGVIFILLLVFLFTNYLYIYTSYLHLKFNLKYKLHYKIYRHKLINNNNCQETSMHEVEWMYSHKSNQLTLLSSINKLTEMIPKKKSNTFSAFAPVLIMCFSVELLIELCIIPIYDMSLGGGLSYSYWLTLRFIICIFSIPSNLFIILPIYKIVNSSIKYNYVDDNSMWISKVKNYV